MCRGGSGLGDDVVVVLVVVCVCEGGREGIVEASQLKSVSNIASHERRFDSCPDWIKPLC